MKYKDSFHPYALISIIGWAVAYVFTRISLQYYTPMELGFLRYFIASLIFIVIILLRKVPLPRLKDLPLFLVSAICGFALYMYLFNTGVQYTEAATVSVVLSIMPILTAVFASLLYKEKLAVLQWIAVAIEFVGILIIQLTGVSVTVNQGILWLIGGATVFAVYNIAQRALMRTYTPFQASSYSIILGTLFLSFFAPKGFAQVKAAPMDQLINLLVLGIFSSAISYLTWAEALKRARKTSEASNYLFFTPLITAVLGVIFADEIPDLSTVIGGVVILFGMFLFNSYNRREKA